MTAFVVIVVLTPREWISAFLGYAAILAVALAFARVPPRRVARGLAIEVPFVLFAVLLPFVGHGPDNWLGLSIPGMWAAWNILVKATLGVVAATLLASTTLPVDIVAGLQALRIPSAFVAILTFFVRYVDVVADQYQRMRVAQRSRGLHQRPARARGRVLAHGLGALFVRSFERGEQVHLALVSRGYEGQLPVPESSGAAWPAVVLPAAAAVIAMVHALW